MRGRRGPEPGRRCAGGAARVAGGPRRPVRVDDRQADPGGGRDGRRLGRRRGACCASPDEPVAPGRDVDADSRVGSGADVPSQLRPGLCARHRRGRDDRAGWRRSRSTPCSSSRSRSDCRPPTSTARPTGSVCRAGDDADLALNHAALASALEPGAGCPSGCWSTTCEPAALSLCPAIGEALDALRQAGADARLRVWIGSDVIGSSGGRRRADRRRRRRDRSSRPGFRCHGGLARRRRRRRHHP